MMNNDQTYNSYLLHLSVLNKDIFISFNDEQSELNKGKKEKLIFKKKFNKKGIHYIYFITDNLLTNMSYMFYDSSSLKQKNLSSFKADNVISMICMIF